MVTANMEALKIKKKHSIVKVSFMAEQLDLIASDWTGVASKVHYFISAIITLYSYNCFKVQTWL